MESSWVINSIENDGTIWVTFTIFDKEYKQHLLQYWKNGKQSGGIRVDTPENTKSDLDAYMSDYESGLSAQQQVS